MIWELFNSVNYFFSVYAIPTFTVMVLMFLAGAAILVHEGGSREGRLFFLTVILICGWLFSFSWMYCSVDERTALFWAKAAYAFVPFIPSAIYHFTVVVLHTYPRSRLLVRLSWIVSFSFSYAILSTDTLIDGLYQYWWGYYPKYGILSAPYLLFFFVMVVMSLREYWVEYRKILVENIHKKRVRLLMIAFAISYLGSVDYFAKFGISIYPFGYIPIFVFLLIAGQTIWRYRLMDLTPAFAANQILEAMQGGVFVVDLDGVIRVVNHAACALSGYMEKELVGKPVGTFFESYSLGDFKLGGAGGEEVLRDHVMGWRTKEGGRIYVSVSTSVVKDRNHSPAGVVYVAIDITERKRIEEALRDSESKWRQLVETAPDFILTVDREGRILFINRVVPGLSVEEVTGSSAYNHMPVESREKFREVITRVFETGKAESFEIVARGPYDTIAWYSARIAPIKRNGEVLFAIIISTDITERKRAEELLAASLERVAQQQAAVAALTKTTAFQAQDVLALLRRITEVDAETLGAERVSVWRYNKDHSAIVCVDLYEQSTKRHSSGMELASAKYPGYFHALAESDVIKADDANSDSRTSEFSQDYLTPLGITSMMGARIHFQGTLNGVLCHEHVGPIRRWTADEQMFVVAMANLISLALEWEERQRAQQELIEKASELARSKAEREQLELFAYVASHDLREPLQKILGFGDLLKKRCAAEIGEKGREYLERMQNATLRLNQLIEDILKLSRVQKQEQRWEEVDLNEVVREVVSDLEVLLVKSNGKVETGKLPVIYADRVQMHQLFQNLISNALKFRKKEEAPRAAVHSRSLESGFIEITVRDNGIGFEEKYLDKIFRPFERLHTRGEYPGSGIGLAICQRIVERHRGRITAKSKPGEGTTFVILLPENPGRGDS